jgi:cell division protein FtsB
MPGFMNCRSLIVVAALGFAASAAATARAQTSPSSDHSDSTPQSSGQPAAQSDQAQTASPASTPAAGVSAKPAAKKVWTNDDVGELHDDAPISTFAEPNAKPSRTATGAKPAASGGKNAQYREKIAKLKAEIPPLDSQIAQLQAAIDGQPTGDSKTSTRPFGVKLDSWQAQLQELQKKRDDTLAHIAALQDQARHSGVPANNIP